MVGLAVLVLLARRAPLFVNPVFVVEDGSLFFADQLRDGFSPFATYNGAVYLAQRLVALFVSPLPITVAPRTYYVLACILAVLPMAVVLQRRAEPVFGPWAWRAALLVFLVVMPGSDAIQGTIANLQWWYLAALVITLAIPPPSSPLGRYGELSALAVMGLTGLGGVFVLPLAVWQAVRNRSRHEWLRVAVVAATSGVQLAIFLGSPRLDGQRDLGGLLEVAPYVVNRFVSGTFLFGEVNNSLYWASENHVFMLGLSVLVTFATIAFAVVDWRSSTPLWLLASAGVAGSGLLTIPTTYVLGMTMGPPSLQSRYFAGAIGLFALVVFRTAATSPTRWARLGALVILGVSSIGVVGDVRANPWERPPGSVTIEAFEECLESSTEPLCDMTGFPPDWHIRVPPDSRR